LLYSTFYLDENSLLALPILSILEIGRSFKVHPVHGAPEVIEGLINLRGKVVTVLNVRSALGLPKAEESNESRMYILKNNQEIKDVAPADVHIKTSTDNIGLHVTEMSDVIDIDPEEMLPVPANLHHPYYKKIIRKNDLFILILDLEKIVNLSDSSDIPS
jgi:purine-binding chemotaxis protein CheW